MKKSFLSCVVLFAGIFAGSFASAQTPTMSRLIRPGKSVAGVKLDSTLTDFMAVFPKHPNIDDGLYKSVCGGSYFQWVDLDLGASGVTAYLQNDRIYQISVQTPRFSLPNGVKMQTSEEQVKILYPSGRAYILLGSGSDIVGGRDLVYWVDEKAGVAFEFYWNRQKRNRLVGSIDVFTPGTDYQPDGCISPPQRWQELKPSTRKPMS